ncbi:cache domain-containing protein [uncultured Brevundimonas sp.]|uniref:cache domain-containing protein n=1 Tax=uncultured Brevundimonas sp. TaxID=213418 RepID=UPI002624A2B4|nr:cache domain-containing protein [uncultured Brevundimonas sp.]
MNIAKRFTVATVAIALVSAAVTGLAVNLGIQSTLFQIEQQTRQVETTRLADQVNRKIETLRQDLVVLMRGAPIAELMEATPAGGLPPLRLVAETERLFKAEALAKPHYLGLRAIGVRDGGRELVRINQAQGGGDVVVASQEEMQRKGYRDFFQKTIVLPPGGIHMSDVDLNVDKGTIQQNPIVPVLRASAPVYGRNGRPLGIAIINVDMAPTLNRIRNLGYPGRSYCEYPGTLPSPPGPFARLRLSIRSGRSPTGRFSYAGGPARYEKPEDAKAVGPQRREDHRDRSSRGSAGRGQDGGGLDGAVVRDGDLDPGA